VDDLHAAGIRLSLAGDDLHYQTRPGVSINAHREQIAANKLALMAELRLREQITAAASAAQFSFDRQRYDALWERWHALQREPEAISP
jgi:flagellar biosynthesis/type III secretory pathway chaperone